MLGPYPVPSACLLWSYPNSSRSYVHENEGNTPTEWALIKKRENKEKKLRDLIYILWPSFDVKKIFFSYLYATEAEIPFLNLCLHSSTVGSILLNVQSFFVVQILQQISTIIFDAKFDRQIFLEQKKEKKSQNF